MFKRTGWGFTITALLVAACIWALSNSDKSNNQDGFHFFFGIDLAGGTELTYRIDRSKIEYDIPENDLADVIKNMIANRLNAYGLKEISIAAVGAERLVIQIPGAADSQSVAEIKRQIEQTGQLEFLIEVEDRQGRAGRLATVVAQYNASLRTWADAKEADPTSAPNPPPMPDELKKLEAAHDAYRVASVAYDKERKIRQRDGRSIDDLELPTAPEFIVLPRAKTEGEGESEKLNPFESEIGSYVLLRYGAEGDYRVSGRHLRYANPITDEYGRPAIGFGFNPTGATLFGQVTSSNVEKPLAIVLDGRVIQTANIKSRISSDGQITGSFGYEEVQGIVNILRGGSLPAKPQLISETTVGSQFGAEARAGGMQAIVAGLIVILVFMLIYYMVGGVVANVALVLNVILILTYVLIFRQTLTFPGIAGILLTIGMSVDANILIFERVREELRKGKSLVAALGTGYQRAFWVIFDSNLTTFITGVVLFNFGSGPVKGFAVTLIAGIIASFFTAVFVTRMILSFLLNRGILKGFPMLKVIDVPRVAFQSYRKPFLILSLVGIVVTWGLFVIPRGRQNYGTDFNGGAKITFKLNQVVKTSRLYEFLNGLPADERAILGDYSLQTVGAEAAGEARSFILLSTPDERAVNIADAQEPPAGGEEPGGEEPVSNAPAATGDTARPAVVSEEVVQNKVREVLERLLEREELMLPDAFPQTDVDGSRRKNPRWVKASETVGGVASVEDVQGLEMDINVLHVDPALELELASALERHLARAFADSIVPEGQGGSGAFRGIRTLKLEKAAAPIALPGGDSVTRYHLATTGYRLPDENLRSVSDVPTHMDVENAVKAFFRGQSTVLDEMFPAADRVIELSEPFPEVVTIGPTVAANLQRQALIAIFIAMVAIVFYLSLRFEFVFGLAAICALAHDVLIAIGIIAMTDALLGDVFSLKINLPEVAAFLTIIGYSVNDTIVVFDRIRENLRAGKKKIEFEDLVNASINQTLARTIWTSATTLVVVLSLLILGGEPVKGFTFAFAIGLVAGTYSSVFVASPALIFLRKKALERAERIKEEAAHAA